jgi:hypothetical protein
MLGVWFAELRSPLRRAAGEAMLGGEAVLRRFAAPGAADVHNHLRPQEADREGTFAGLESLRLNLSDAKIALQRVRALETGLVQATPIPAG